MGLRTPQEAIRSVTNPYKPINAIRYVGKGVRLARFNQHDEFQKVEGRTITLSSLKDVNDYRNHKPILYPMHCLNEDIKIGKKIVNPMRELFKFCYEEIYGYEVNDKLFGDSYKNCLGEGYSLRVNLDDGSEYILTYWPSNFELTVNHNNQNQHSILSINQHKMYDMLFDMHMDVNGWIDDGRAVDATNPLLKGKI